jgi:hypothetical protein
MIGDDYYLLKVYLDSEQGPWCEFYKKNGSLK